MMISKNLTIWFIVLFLSIGYVVAQDNQGIIISKIEQANDSSNEKLFVHTDQDFYLAGEIVWFKIYLSDANKHQPENLSSVAYLEILDNKQKPVSQVEIEIENGVGKGSIFLPYSLASGNFKIKAYTAWMKNFNREYSFEKTITIINSLQTSEFKNTTKSEDFDIQFFPEGGNLITGIESKVAFKAVDGFGNGANFTAKLLNNLDQEIVIFKPLKFGIGNFKFKPEKNIQYRAVINYKNRQIVKDLIPDDSIGYTMRLNEINSDSIQITVAQKGDNDLSVYLIAHQRQKNIIAQKAIIENGIVKFDIDRNKITEGISCFTVFNSKLQPVCERLYFKRPSKKLQLTIKTNEVNYPIREKVSLQILANDETGNSLASNLSLAVFLKDSLQNITEANIFSYLWLKSDIKDEIENANYYFENDNKETNQALDNLLLTQGFRKFKGESVLQEEKSLLKFKPEYQQHIITGKIFYKENNKPAADIMMTLSVLGNTAHLYGAKSDAQGNLSFYTKNINGPVKLALQTNSLEDSIYKLELNSPFINWKFEDKPNQLKLSKNYSTSLLNRSINMQVQNVYHTDSLKKFLDLSEENTTFYGNSSDKMYRLNQYVRFPSLEEVLREYVPEVVVKKKENNFSLGIYNVQDKIYLDNSPLVLLDGVPVKDTNRLMKYNVLKIEKMDIVAKKYYLGPLVFDGILNFSSVKGNFKDFDLDPNLILVDYDGLQLQREFYGPKYETPKERKSHLPDFRNLLYWNADVKTSSTGKSELDFYTSDLKGNYIIVLQGLSNNGRVGYNTTSFKVN